jgi:Mce-associated membrane protein
VQLSFAKARRSHRTLPVALLVLAIALAGLAGWSRSQLTQQQALTRDGAAAAAAARQEVLTLTTVSRENAAASLERLRAGATEPFASDIAQSSGALQQLLSTQDVSSSGVIVESGISSIDKNSAVVLVAADANVTAASAQPAVRRYRLSARMSRVGDRWLVSELEFVS